MTDKYVFARDFRDNNRINLQHYLWVELFGYHIHPSIPTDNEKLRIADVGTGTGIWLTDLARRLPPSVTLDGLDISFAALPPHESLPPNMALHHWDLLADEEVPAHLRGVYDIVHVRNFVLVILDDKIESVVRRLVQLLKPDGYIQFAEPDMTSWRIETITPNTKTSASTAFWHVAVSQRPGGSTLTPTWPKRLEEICAQAGLCDVQRDVRDAPGYMAVASHECNLVISEMIAKKTSNQLWAEEIERLLPEVEREIRDGVFWAWTRWTVVARLAE
ncbi:class I SAM-dependent methyltransferase [Aspergillus stella-maris]|uniref:class I SAM-dependent methyltransferase n=1 Tax=Aspergillus stella-maris TaxID=1810926 RepID=UPI003CCCBAE1